MSLSHLHTWSPIPLRKAPPRVNKYPPEIGGTNSELRNQQINATWCGKMVLKARNIVDYLMEGCGAGFNINTPLKFNIAPENVLSQKERIVFQPSFFQGLCFTSWEYSSFHWDFTAKSTVANSTAIQNYRSPVWYLEQVLAYSTFISNVGTSSEFHHFFTPKKILTTPFWARWGPKRRKDPRDACGLMIFWRGEAG